MRIKEHEIDLLNTLEDLMNKCKVCDNAMWKMNDGSSLVHFPIEWTPLSKYILIQDHPGYTPNDFWKIGENYFIRKEFFGIIGMSNCNVSPSTSETKCVEFIKKFIKIIDPEVIIAMGPYTHSYFISNTKNRIPNAYACNYYIHGSKEYKYQVIASRSDWSEFNSIFDKMDYLLRRRR